MTSYPVPLLTERDMSALTGVEQAAAQIRWLDEAGIPYRVGRDGKPRTTWGAVDGALLGRRGSVPDFRKVS